ncbi:protein C10 [Parasteatoda tepidariorum]|nr:protein C10 [Parasteatoda tepidariorum]
MTQPPVLTVDRAKAAIRDIITTYSLPEHAARLAEAKNNAGNDMLLHMQLVFPLATQIQQDVIPNYGFSSDKDGLLQFTQTIKTLAKENPDVAQLFEELKSYLIPSLVLPFSQSGSS